MTVYEMPVAAMPCREMICVSLKQYRDTARRFRIPALILILIKNSVSRQGHM